MAKAYQDLRKYRDAIDPTGIAIEIGSERGEGSTEFFKKFFASMEMDFYSVDFEDEAYGRARELIGPNAIQALGEDFFLWVFSAFHKKLSFLYLDGFDWIYPNMNTKRIGNQTKTYIRYGLSLSNANSIESHREIANLALPYMAERCVIIIDDTWQENGSFNGKGTAAVPLLISNGFTSEVCGSSPGHSFIVLTRQAKDG